MSVALITHRAVKIRRIVLLPVACVAVPYFSRLFHKRHDFRKNIVEHKICGLILSAVFVCSAPQIEVRKCLLSFGAEYFVFQVAIQKFKDQDI